MTANPDYFKPPKSPSLAGRLADMANREFDRLGIDDRIDVEAMLKEADDEKIDTAQLGDDLLSSDKGFLA